MNSDPNCIFCKIIAGEAPGKIIYRDDSVTAFRDAHPLTSTHILVVPNRHIASVNELEESDAALVGPEPEAAGHRLRPPDCRF